jgi:TetR/AcrR family transcriptional repressor of nem operon
VQTTDPLARTAASTARGRATRDRIVAAAGELIHAHGVERTTLDDVRAAAAVSKSQLYHYFTDKADLVRAVVGRQAQAVLAAQQPELDEIDSLDRLRRWRDKILALQGHGCTLGCPLGTLVAELADDELGRLALAGAFAAWQNRLRDGLAAIRDHGEILAPADLDALALGLLAATQGGLLLAQATRSVRPLQVALDMALEQVHAGLGRR